MIQSLSRNKAFALYVAFYLFSFLLAHLILHNLYTNDGMIIYLIALDLLATFIIWILGSLIHNASLYDPYWSIFPLVFIFVYILKLDLKLSFYHYIFLFAFIGWSVRLTTNFVINFDGFSYEDWRYKKLRAENKSLWWVINLLGVHLFPTLIVLIQLFATTTIFKSEIHTPILYVFGCIIMAFSFMIQLVADKQMRVFRKQNKLKDKCIRTGLWKHSRHPNYLGEVLFWWGVYIVYFSIVKQMNYMIVAPVLMTCLFEFISIPLMEKKLILTRPSYVLIQKEIPRMFPISLRKIGLKK